MGELAGGEGREEPVDGKVARVELVGWASMVVHLEVVGVGVRATVMTRVA